MSRSLHLIIAVIAALDLTGCALQTDDESPSDPPTVTTSTEVAELSGTAVITMTFRNNSSTATFAPRASSINFAGTITRVPNTLGPGGSDSIANTGIGNIASFHVNYDSGGKSCRFDVASIPNAGNTACMFSKNGQSQGSTFATCTATLNTFDLTTCSQSITFTMQ